MALDFSLDDDFDLLIEDGDIVMGDSLGDDIRIILLIKPGDFANSPFSGAALGEALNSKFSLTERTAIEAELSRQMELHDIPFRALIQSDGTLQLNDYGTESTTNI